MLELFDYKVSFLNQLLKIITPVLLAVATYYFYRARNQYQGELGKVVSRLALACLVGTLAHLFRLGADFSEFLTNLKWGESLMILAFALVSIYAIWPLLTFMRRMAEMRK